jgi:hypothetical protein
MNKEKSAFRKHEVLENYELTKFEYNELMTHKHMFDTEYQGTNCFFCGSFVMYPVVFNYPNAKRKFNAGTDCAEMVHQGSNYEALRLQAAKARERARIQQQYLDTSAKFVKSNPQLAQAANYFQDVNPLIADIFDKTKFGLTEKQIAFLEKLCKEQWQKEVDAFAKLINKANVPALTIGEITTEVTISKYYYKEQAFYGQEKAIIETKEGQTLFTGKTKALVQWLNTDEYSDDVAEFWEQDKKERKGVLTWNKEYYKENTKGIATLEVTFVVEEDNTKGTAKIKNFSPIGTV